MKLLGKQELLDKLKGMPEKFRADVAEEKWCAAALDYQNVLAVTRLIRMDRSDREALIGQFDSKTVEMAYLKAGWWDAAREGDCGQAVRSGADVPSLHETEGIPGSSSVCRLDDTGCAVYRAG